MTVLVVAPSFQTARHVAEIEYKLDRNTWVFASSVAKVQGATPDRFSYIYCWPLHVAGGIGEINAQDIVESLRAAGIPEYKRED